MAMQSQMVVRVGNGGRIKLGKIPLFVTGLVVWITVAGLVGFSLKARAASPERVVFAGSLVPPPAEAAATMHLLRKNQTQATMELEIPLRMRNYAEFTRKVASGKVVSHAEMERRYLPLESDYAALRKWFLKEGFEITLVDSSRLALFVRGTVDQIQKSLNTEVVEVSVEGVSYKSARTAPSMPAAVAGSVLGINGLQPYLKFHKKVSSVEPNFSNRAPYLIGEITGAYNANNLGVTGAGQKIGILIDTVPNDDDLIQFWLINGISQSINNIEKINVTGVQLPPLGVEETLDVEWSSGIAPGAKVRVYAAGSLTFVDINKSLLRIISDLPSQPQLQQLSISLGIGETYLPISVLQAETQYFATIANSGVSILVSSGDEGSNPDQSNDGHATGPLQVEYFSSDPSVTSVGGTNLYLNPTTGQRSSEVGWSGSGGGLSRLFSRPSWQVGIGVPAGTDRLAPDLSLVGGSPTPAYIYFRGQGYSVAGTSWSAPVWAGFCALINEARAKLSQPPLGLLNPRIYPLLGTDSFRDVITGNNGAYRAGSGYDLVTGVGVPDVGVLLQTLTGQNSGPSIREVNPSIGPFAAPVIIMGNNLSGATSVKFNGTEAVITSNLSTQIVTAVPVGASSGKVTVDVASGTVESPNEFTVTGEAVLPAPGVYEGLINFIQGDGNGYFKANVTRTNRFTAQIKINGKVYSFTGAFNRSGNSHVKLSQDTGDIVVDLSFTGSEESPRVAGVLYVGGRLGTLSASRAFYSVAQPAPQQGSYTLLLIPDPQSYPSPQFPQGYGYGRLKVSAAGQVKFSGKLGDAQSLSSSTLLKSGGLFPIYSPLYKKPLGGIAGELFFKEDPAVSDCAGSVAWIRPAQSSGV
ncbi:MAG: Peptidase propeptide, partial [Chthoniobacteraceae bacterium]|nr:Peptidase propeptide [Chthoniobacteraceae bacterium]